MRDMIVSVTRLHLRSLRFFPVFLVHALRSASQAKRAPGFVTGWLGGEGLTGNWTATVWESAEAMRAFRNSGAHMVAMPKLLRWCDESAYTHWEQDEATLPSPQVAYDRLARDGKISKVLTPSARQAAGKTVGDKPPKTAQTLKPAR
jgi:hypothetical protein